MSTQKLIRTTVEDIRAGNLVYISHEIGTHIKFRVMGPNGQRVIIASISPRNPYSARRKNQAIIRRIAQGLI